MKLQNIASCAWVICALSRPILADPGQTKTILTLSSFEEWLTKHSVKDGIHKLSTDLKLLVTTSYITHRIVPYTEQKKGETDKKSNYDDSADYMARIIAGLEKLQQTEEEASGKSVHKPGPSDTSHKGFYTLNTKYQGLAQKLQQIIDTEISLKTDIWSTRKGQTKPITTFRAVADAVKYFKEALPLSDNLEVVFWLFNGDAKDVTGKGTVVILDNAARVDIIDAFKILADSFRKMSKELGKWVEEVEKSLDRDVRGKIGLVRRPTLSLDGFLWPYEKTCERIYEKVEKGIKMPRGDVD